MTASRSMGLARLPVVAREAALCFGEVRIENIEGGVFRKVEII